MATLLVYYSRTGTTKKVAQAIAQNLNCETEEILDVKSRAGVLGYIMSGREASLKKLPAIGQTEFNPGNYDLVIIGTPIWAFDMSSPVRTYLSQNKDKIKKCAIFITQGGNGADRAKKSIEEIIGKTALATLVLSTKEVKANTFTEKMNLFVNQIKSLSN